MMMRCFLTHVLSTVQAEMPGAANSPSFIPYNGEAQIRLALGPVCLIPQRSVLGENGRRMSFKKETGGSYASDYD
jgi:hypothetical protein